MSHIKENKSSLQDIEALEAACKALGCEFLVNDRVRYYGGKTEKADFVCRIPNSTYDLGFKLKKDGTLSFVADGWVYNGTGGAKAAHALLGDNCAKLKLEYGYQRTLREAAKKGAQVKRVQLADGRVEFRLKGGRI